VLATILLFVTTRRTIMYRDHDTEASFWADQQAPPGVPLANRASSEALASSAPTPSSSRNSAGTTCARATRAAAFRRCCRRTGRFDGVQAGYYVRDQW